jgi:hypothetical protein
MISEKQYHDLKERNNLNKDWILLREFYPKKHIPTFVCNNKNNDLYDYCFFIIDKNNADNNFFLHKEELLKNSWYMSLF